jgi:energy-coupling factor transport system permease protein
VTAATAVVLGGVVWPLIIVLVAVLVPAAVARVLPTLLRFALLFSLPIALSALLINLFFFPGGQTVLLRLGPITATAEGLSFAVEILARIAAISGAVTLFYLTTKPSELVLDLERRGVPAQLAFVANASVQTVPAMAERASGIVAAQRARGLDTEGSLLKRLRGIVPIVGPVMLGSINEVEERSMTLEARAFSRPGRRSLLWSPPDAGWQRLLRWLLLIGFVSLVAARFAGLV